MTNCEKDICVSVAMTSYNGMPYIKEQMDSILKNLIDTDELIVSDDGSTDGTYTWLKEIEASDQRIHVIEGPKQGIIKNFEYAIRHCKGRYIFLADQDDIWKSDKREKVLSTFQKENATLVMHDVIVVNENNTEVIMPSFFAYRGSKSGAVANIIKNSYMGCSMAFKAELKEMILPIPEQIQMHDQWIGVLNDLCFEQACLIPDQLLYYRRHEKNNSDFSHNTLPVMIKNRLVFLCALNKRMHEAKKLKHS